MGPSAALWSLCLLIVFGVLIWSGEYGVALFVLLLLFLILKIQGH